MQWKRIDKYMPGGRQQDWKYIEASAMELLAERLVLPSVNIDTHTHTVKRFAHKRQTN